MGSRGEDRRRWVVEEEIGGEIGGDGLLRRRLEVEEVRR